MNNVLVFSRTAIDETGFFHELLSHRLLEMDLPGQSNGYLEKLPLIKKVHPLVDVMGDLLAHDGENSFIASLPAIGVEMLDETPGKKFLGHSLDTIEINQELIDYLLSIDISERLSRGENISNGQIEKIQEVLDSYQNISSTFKAKIQRQLLKQKIHISIWADHPEIKDIIFKAVRSILILCSVYLGTKVKDFTFTSEKDLYNYDTGRTLYGGEFYVDFTNTLDVIEVPLQLETPIQNISTFLNDNFFSVPGAKGSFKVIGESN